MRPSYQDIHYRILYFFAGKGVAVLSHGITKEDAVPGVEIDRAVDRKKKFEADPKAHTYTPGRWRTDDSSTHQKPMQEPMMPTKRKFDSAAVQELYDELIGEDTAAQEEFEEGLVNIEAAQLIHDMRTKAGLSQRELARKVGTSASAINRLESADYEGHTIAMVRRIATALSRRLELRAVPVKAAPRKARTAARTRR